MRAGRAWHPARAAVLLTAAAISSLALGCASRPIQFSASCRTDMGKRESIGEGRSWQTTWFNDTGSCTFSVNGEVSDSADALDAMLGLRDAVEPRPRGSGSTEGGTE